MNGFDTLILIFSLIGFGVGFVIQFRLHKYVSKEKVIQVEDVTKLWKNSIPPKEILNEEGLRLYRYFQAGLFVFMGGCFFMVANGFLTSFIGFLSD